MEFKVDTENEIITCYQNGNELWSISRPYGLRRIRINHNSLISFEFYDGIRALCGEMSQDKNTNKVTFYVNEQNNPEYFFFNLVLTIEEATNFIRLFGRKENFPEKDFVWPTLEE